MMLEFLFVVIAGIGVGAVVFGAAVGIMALAGIVLTSFVLLMLGWFCGMLGLVIALGVSL